MQIHAHMQTVVHDFARELFNPVHLPVVYFAGISGADRPGAIDIEITRVGHREANKIESPVHDPSQVVLAGCMRGIRARQEIVEQVESTPPWERVRVQCVCLSEAERGASNDFKSRRGDHRVFDECAPTYLLRVHFEFRLSTDSRSKIVYGKLPRCLSVGSNASVPSLLASASSSLVTPMQSKRPYFFPRNLK